MIHFGEKQNVWSAFFGSRMQMQHISNLTQHPRIFCIKMIQINPNTYSRHFRYVIVSCSFDSKCIYISQSLIAFALRPAHLANIEKLFSVSMEKIYIYLIFIDPSV